jgi:hypothetical protein
MPIKLLFWQTYASQGDRHFIPILERLTIDTVFDTIKKVFVNVS